MANEKQYILRIIDFETTGIPSEDNPHSVVEAAFIDIDAETKQEVSNYKTLVVPTTDMDLEARAVHHISHEEATGKGLRWAIVASKIEEKSDDQVIVYVAHNADYEKNFFNPDGALWIDTYKVALKLYPDAPKHSNQVLKYFLDIRDADNHHPPHRALPDCRVTSKILIKMADKIKLNEMIHISKQPPYLTKMPFGKHYGEKFEDIPHDYLRWISGQSDIDEAVIAAANRVLG